MISRLFAFALLLTALIGPNALQATARPGQAPSSLDHISWVAEALKRMQTVKPGMTREDLLKVFTTEGGLSTGLRRTFVSRDCPYFKVDVQFEAVGRPAETLVVGSLSRKANKTSLSRSRGRTCSSRFPIDRAIGDDERPPANTQANNRLAPRAART
jgi:hypothetical protein